MAADWGIISNSLLIYYDYESEASIAINPVNQSQTEHVDIIFNFIRELIEEKRIVVRHVSNVSQLADLFAKPLDFNRFVDLRKTVGVCEV